MDLDVINLKFCYNKKNNIMCISIPYKIIEIYENEAEVESMDGLRKKKLSLGMIKDNLKIGDWVLSLNNFAIETVSEEEVIELKNILK